MARIEERHAALLATVKERAVVPGEPKPRFFFFSDFVFISRSRCVEQGCIGS